MNAKLESIFGELKRHCRNPIHKTTKNKIAGCSIGSEFHKTLYDDCQSLLQDFVDKLTNSSPVAIRAAKEKHRP